MNPESSLRKRNKSLYLYTAEWQLAPPPMLPSLIKVANVMPQLRLPLLPSKLAQVSLATGS